MILYHNIEIDKAVLLERLHNLTNQIYKLLPMREQGEEWIKPLQMLIVQLSGLSSLLRDKISFLALVSKLQGLKILQEQKDFMLYRRVIFECLNSLSKVIQECQKL